MRTLIKSLLLLFLCSIVAIPAFSQKKDKKEPSGKTERFKMKTKMDTVSYIIGSDIAKNLKQSKIDINADALSAGVRDGLNGDSIFTKAQVDSIMQVFQQDMMKKMEDENAMKAGENKDKGKAFLAENSKKEGIKVTASGLQYKILNEGTGVAPLASDEVTVNYKGMLIDGTVFDKNEEGSPISFGLSKVIPGWTEGLQLLKPGGKAILYIPSELGYGDREVGPIPAGSTLIFEVELLSVKKPD